uniref:Complement C8 gamma chain n=1 Tax=Anser brachyrhynchus TaxID=132585 RepID=A0A8B9CNP5_9AVES
RLAGPERSGHPLAGRWFLVGVASRCGYLAEHSHQLEATAVTVAVPDGQSLTFSTFKKLDGMCWEIRQRYLPAGPRGRFFLKGRGYGSKVDVVVAETDHSSYAILYYQKGRSISVKLYGRSSKVSDAIADKFEQRARAVGLSEDVTYYFPTYGGCHVVTQEQGHLRGWLHLGGPALGFGVWHHWHGKGRHIHVCLSSWCPRVTYSPHRALPRGQGCKDRTVACGVPGVRGCCDWAE